MQKKVRSFLRLYVFDFRILVRHGSVTPNQVAPQRLLRSLRNVLVSWAAFRHVLIAELQKVQGSRPKGRMGIEGVTLA